MQTDKRGSRVTVKTLQTKKQKKEKISVLTAYDFCFSQIFDRAGIDIILVGDSAANVFSGLETTLPITLDQMIYHAQAVVRGAHRAFVVVDLPFGSYHESAEQAVTSAIRIMKESGAHAVKMEGGNEIVPAIKKIIAAGIPVMGHLGLTPQSIHQLGSFGVQANNADAASLLKQEALLLQELGCFSVVLEKVPAALASEISDALLIPIIGIGAGNGCDGQVLVMHDLLGLNSKFHPKFVRKYLQLESQIQHAVSQYIQDVASSDFPGDAESY